MEDNINFYRKKKNKKIDLSVFNIDKKLSDKISKNEGLSGGEMMRISILRSLIETRAIMIYDEPTAALDGKNSKEVLEKLLSLDQTVIIITHKIDEEILNKFDKIIDI